MADSLSVMAAKRSASARFANESVAAPSNVYTVGQVTLHRQSAPDCLHRLHLPIVHCKKAKKKKWSEITQSGGRPLFAFLSLLLLRVEKPYWSTQGLLDRWRITRNDLQTSSSSAIHKYVLDESIKGRRRRRRTSKGPSRPARKDFICLFIFLLLQILAYWYKQGFFISFDIINFFPSNLWSQSRVQIGVRPVNPRSRRKYWPNARRLRRNRKS